MPSSFPTFMSKILHCGIFNFGLARLDFLDEILGVRARFCFASTNFGCLDATLGWGRSPYSRKANHYARKYDLPYLSLEDGFLRSFGTGDRSPPLSLVLDELGIYYDSTQPSALEALLAGDLDVLVGDDALVDQALMLLLEKCLSK